MVIYVILFFLVIWGFLYVDVLDNRKAWNNFYRLEFVAIILIVTFQWRLGGDNLSYEIYYEDIPTFNNLDIKSLVIGKKYQPLWYIFNSLLKTITPSYVFFHFAHSLFVCSIIFWFLKRYTKYSLSVIMIFVLTFDFFYFNIEIQRESMAIAVFLLMFKYLENNKLYKYYALIPIAFLLHASSIFLVLLPLLLFIVKKLDSPLKILLFAVFGSVLLVNIFRYLIGSFMSYVNSEVVGNVLDQASYYSDTSVNFNNSFLMGLFASLPVIMLLYIRLKGNLKFDIFAQICIIYIIICFSNAYVTGIYRIGNYLLFPYYICLVNTIGALYKNKKFKFPIILILMLIMTLVYYNESRPASFLGPDKMHINMWVPYKSIFD